MPFLVHFRSIIGLFFAHIFCLESDFDRISRSNFSSNFGSILKSQPNLLTFVQPLTNVHSFKMCRKMRSRAIEDFYFGGGTKRL